MRAAKSLATGLALSLPGLFLLYFAIVAFESGVAISAAMPVQNYLVRRQPLPVANYTRTADLLTSGAVREGGQRIFGSEASIYAGDSPASQIWPLRSALAMSPADARGWMLLSDALHASDHKRAAQALGVSFELARYDYWIAGARAERAALLWSDLNFDDRDSAVRQVRLLWEEPILRPQLYGLLTTPQGISLLNRAFVGRRDEVVALNRWVSEQLRRWRNGP
jgi:hypothetical protein